MSRIAFVGGRAHGYQLLRSMLEAGEHVVCVLALQEDDHEPVRFDKMVCQVAAEHGVPAQPAKRIGRSEAELLRAQKPDLIIVMGWRTIIPKEILDLPPLGCVAVHDSLLPRYRGFAPLNWSILNGETETGVTMFHLTEEVDAGDIIAQQAIAIEPDETGASLYEKVCQAAPALVMEHLDGLKRGEAPRIPQDHSKATFACARIPQDGLIHWAATTASIDRLIRALGWPYPGAYTHLEGVKLTVWRARPVQPAPRYEGRVPGRVVGRRRGKGVEALTGDGILLLQEVQLDGEEPCRADEVIKSVRATLGWHMPECWTVPGLRDVGESRLSERVIQ